jgi:hypothetical protein
MSNSNFDFDFDQYKYIIMLVLTLIVVNWFVLPILNIESMAPVGQQYYEQNDYPSSQDIINVRNMPLNEYEDEPHMQPTKNDYRGKNYNPAHVKNTKQGKYVSYAEPDTFNGHKYNA